MHFHFHTCRCCRASRLCRLSDLFALGAAKTAQPFSRSNSQRKLGENSAQRKSLSEFFMSWLSFADALRIKSPATASRHDTQGLFAAKSKQQTAGSSSAESASLGMTT